MGAPFQTIAQLEREHIGKALALLNGDKRAAADALGISLNTLYNRLNEYGEAFEADIRAGLYTAKTGEPTASALWFWAEATLPAVRPSSEIVGQSIALQPGRYCVYEHVVDGAVCYVGMGQWNRPFESSRNELWDEIVGTANEIQVRIVAWFDDEASARFFEAEVIRQRNPACNIMRPNSYPLFDAIGVAAVLS